MSDLPPPDSRVTVLLDALAFPDSPRWHDGRLWFTDLHDHLIIAATESGQSEVVGVVEGQPSGLGWLPDGRLLVVSMVDRCLLRLDGDSFEEVADLSELAPFNCNDLVVDAQGRAYVGNYGFDLEAGAEPVGTTLVCVEPDGDAWVVADQLLFPNGMVIIDGGEGSGARAAESGERADRPTLVVAESFGQRLSAFDMEPDGSLSNPRVWCDLRPNVPDGICLDAEGGVWVADPVHNGVMRVVRDVGAVDWISTGDRHAYACALGGSDGRTLYICTGTSSDPAKTLTTRAGRIEAARVAIPAADHVESESASDAASGNQG